MAMTGTFSKLKKQTTTKISAALTRRMTIVLGENDDERESVAGGEDDNKSVRSKGSIYSGVAKSIRGVKLGGGPKTKKGSVHGSQKSGSKRDRQGKELVNEDAPVPTKLDLPTRQLHTDNLDE